MKKPGVMFYFDVRPCIKRLSIEQKGELFESILDYGEFGIVPEFEGILGVAWDFIQPKLDRDTEQYDLKVEKSQFAVYSRECKKNGDSPLSFENWKQFYIIQPNQTIASDAGSYPTSISSSTTILDSASKEDTETDKPPMRYPFAHPTEEEVRTYCQKNGYKVDPQHFVDYYTSNGWRVGKNPMKDWRAAVRNWERKDVPNGKIETEQFHSYGIEL